jgi:ferritin-like metal-binding protein YciE
MLTTAEKSKRTSSGQGASGKSNDSLLEEFFLDAVKDIYWAEKHLTNVLPKMAKAASSSKLQDAFKAHLEETKNHVSRLEEVFDILGRAAKAKKCEAMDGLTKEGESIIEETKEGTATRDVGLIMAAQKVEHYEIATYGGLVQLANILGYEDASEILASTLAEEKKADDLLSNIAENNVNYEASEEQK